MRSLHRFVKTVVAITLLAAAAAIGALAHGGDATKIHGCVVKDSKFVRIVGPNDSCKAGETALDWNAQGPTGLQGSAGPQGLEGPQGEPGTPGLSGVEYVIVNSETSSSDFRTVMANCPDGKQPIGGGAFVVLLSGAGPVGLVVSSPLNQPGNVGWIARAREMSPADGSWFVQATAICAFVS